MNYSIKINVLKIKGSSLVNLKGKVKTKQCIVIPVEDSDLYVGKKGVYLNMQAVELKEPKYEQSHFLRCDVEKEVYEAMTDEQKKAIPIVGNMQKFEHQSQPMQPSATVEFESSADDDLPF